MLSACPAQAIEKSNPEMAKLHAENSIRQKNQAVNFLRLSSRMEAVAQRVEASKNMQSLGVAMGNVVKSMGVAIESMDVEKLTNTMDQFEKQFETRAWGVGAEGGVASPVCHCFLSCCCAPLSGHTKRRHGKVSVGLDEHVDARRRS